MWGGGFRHVYMPVSQSASAGTVAVAPHEGSSSSDDEARPRWPRQGLPRLVAPAAVVALGAASVVAFAVARAGQRSLGSHNLGSAGVLVEMDVDGTAKEPPTEPILDDGPSPAPSLMDQVLSGSVVPTRVVVGTLEHPGKRCGNSVCYTGQTCCPSTAGGLCGTPGSICCGLNICAPGSECCPSGMCAAPGSSCCDDVGAPGVCAAGSTCCPSGLNGTSVCCGPGMQCCPPESGLVGCCPIQESLPTNVTTCGKMRCIGGSVCCKDRICGSHKSHCCGDIICAAGSICCGNGLCASPGSSCCGGDGYNNSMICGPESRCCDSGVKGHKMCCGPSFQCCPKGSGLDGCCPIQNASKQELDRLAEEVANQTGEVIA